MNFSDEWLTNYSAQVGNEIGIASSQLHEITNWSIGIVMAVVTAVALSDKSYPQPWTLGVAVVGFMLVMRFFIRSCLSYVNLDKWNNIQRAIIQYQLSENGPGKERLKESVAKRIEQYHLKWFSPRRIRKLLWSNLKLGYVYLFAITGFLCGLGFGCSDWCKPSTWLLACVLLAAVVYEIIIFPRKTYFKYVDADES